MANENDLIRRGDLKQSLLEPNAKFIEPYAVERLIDGNALEKFFLNESKRLREQMEDEQCTTEEKNYIRAFMPTVEWARKIVKHQPTMDAEPVVYAHWEDEYGGKFANPRWRCSACKEKALYTFEVNSLGNEVEKQELSTRCPECGAHMYREGNEDGK